MANAKQNLTKYDLASKSVPKGGSTETKYKSSSVMGKVGSGGATRASQYTLESQKKK